MSLIGSKRNISAFKEHTSSSNYSLMNKSMQSKKKESDLRQKSQAQNFLKKLYDILQNPQYKDIISWDETGTQFVVKKMHEFCEEILPHSYKHNNFSSFIRQLNLYDFHKIRNNKNEHVFEHRLFIRGKEELLKQIKRKNSIKSHNKFDAFYDANDFDKNKFFNEGQKSLSLIEYNSNNNSAEKTFEFSKKKITKKYLEKLLVYLVQNMNESREKQRILEEKVEKLEKVNEESLIQNQKLLKEVINKTDYNKKLEAIVCFALEMVMNKSNIVNNSEIKNMFLSNDLNNSNLPDIKIDINKLNLANNNQDNNRFIISEPNNNAAKNLVQKKQAQNFDFQGFLSQLLEKKPNFYLNNKENNNIQKLPNNSEPITAIQALQKFTHNQLALTNNNNNNNALTNKNPPTNSKSLFVITNNNIEDNKSLSNDKQKSTGNLSPIYSPKRQRLESFNSMFSNGSCDLLPNQSLNNSIGNQEPNILNISGDNSINKNFLDDGLNLLNNPSNNLLNNSQGIFDDKNNDNSIFEDSENL